VGADEVRDLPSPPVTPAHLPGVMTATPTLSGLEPLLSIEELSE
jgi:hypothetical protein